MTAEEMAIWDSLSRVDREVLIELGGRLSPWASASRLWTHILNGKQQASLGGDVSHAWQVRGTIGMWMEVTRQVNRFAAMIQLGEKIGFLLPAVAIDLRERIGLPIAAAKTVEARPIWDRQSRVLWLNGKPIRPIKILNRPSSFQIILDTFEAAGWPATIEVPANLDLTQQRLHQVTHSLNARLSEIHFTASHVDRSITWRRGPKPKSRRSVDE